MEAILSKASKFNLHDSWVEREPDCGFTQDENSLGVAQFERESWEEVLWRMHALAVKDKGSSVEDGIEDPQSHSLELEDSDHIEDLETLKEIVEISPDELDSRVKEAQAAGFEQARLEFAAEYESRFKTLSGQLLPVIERIDLITRASEEMTAALAALAVDIGEKLARTTLSASPAAVREFIQNSIVAAEQDLGSSGRMKLPKEWEGLKDDLDLESKFPNLSISYDEDLVPGDLRVEFGGVGFEDFLTDRYRLLEAQLASADVGGAQTSNAINSTQRENLSENESMQPSDDDQLKTHDE